MSKQPSLARLAEQEKILYLEVEQLRYRLYLHDSSIIFEIVSAFYFAWQDISKLFRRNATITYTQLEVKKRSLASLMQKKRFLLFLSNTPYAWFLSLINGTKDAMSSLQMRKQPEKSQSKKSYLIFGATDASDLQSRSVQIARALAKKSKVIYIEGVFDEGRKPYARVVESTKLFTSIRLTAKKSIHLNYQKPTQKELSFLKQSLKLINPLVYVHHPFWSLLLPLKRGKFIFDHAYNFAQNKNASPHILGEEKKLIKKAHTITAPHKKLLRNKKDIYIPNGVEWEHFKDTSKMIQTCDVGLCWIKKPVLGYIGTLDEKIDEVLLGHLAVSFPSASIVLVGNTDYRPVIEVAEQHPNIFPVGKQPYKKLPLFLQSFDILITPYKYNRNATTIHSELPLYLTSGKPIISTTSPTYEVRYRPFHQAKKYLYLPKTHEEWTLAIAEALKEKRRSKKRLLRIAAAKKLSWKIPML
jgi:glycosyltransferase involved in cell wall biosynthesis